ncbi:MAG: SAM-dependent methyltransferase [Candidatus Omnitrophica bacterium]|nr:SAM-dependent methyltransferase [Candidatus Omnitrophota bacterium]
MNKSFILHLFILWVFMANFLDFTPLSQADEWVLPKPGVLVHESSVFNPPILKGLKVYPDNPFRFDFVLDTGDRGVIPCESNVIPGSSSVIPAKAGIQNQQQKNEVTKLIKYFLASITIPEKDLWVNLSPYEKNRIIPHSFGLTEMGRDLLAEDYILKQMTASLIYPEGAVGKKFWKRVYEEAGKRFGTTNVPVNTFNKVWIVPEKAEVFENEKAGAAYVVEAKLKVMLEEDYLAMSKNLMPTRGHVPFFRDVSPSTLPGEVALNMKASQGNPRTPIREINALGSKIIREIVIPQLTKEVNENKNFAQLRQVYNSLILATWYKKKIKDSILSQVYADKNKVIGVEYKQSVILALPTRAMAWPSERALNVKTTRKNAPNDIELIYQRYLQAFKKGVYNYIKEEQDLATQKTIPRKYFSGGVSLHFFEKGEETNLGYGAAMVVFDSKTAPQEVLLQINNAVTSGEVVVTAAMRSAGNNRAMLHKADDSKRLDALKQLIIKEIHQNEGAIPFEQFMRMSLYAPQLGFYTSGAVKFGTQDSEEKNDFNTAPIKMSPYFGRGVAKQLNEMWENMGSPAHFEVIEMGAGTGILARDILKEIEEEYPSLYQAIKYTILEISPELIKIQKDLFRDNKIPIPEDISLGVPETRIKVFWKEGSALDVDKSFSGVQGVFISNELPDTFPVRRIKFENGNILESYIGATSQGELYETWQKCSDPKIMEYLKLLLGGKDEKDWEKRAQGRTFAVNLQAMDWIKKIGSVIKKGYVITFDYGNRSFDELDNQKEPMRFYGHVEDGSPVTLSQVLASPGLFDITASVHFHVISQSDRHVGLVPMTNLPVPQDEFFMNLQQYRNFGWPGFYVLIQAKGDTDLEGRSLMGLQNNMRFLNGRWERVYHGTDTDIYQITPVGLETYCLVVAGRQDTKDMEHVLQYLATKQLGQIQSSINLKGYFHFDQQQFSRWLQENRLDYETTLFPQMQFLRVLEKEFRTYSGRPFVLVLGKKDFPESLKQRIHFIDEEGGHPLGRNGAMKANALALGYKGGIDLSRADKDLQTQVSHGRIQWRFDRAMLHSLKPIVGLSPDIIGWYPLMSLRRFLDGPGAF